MNEYDDRIRHREADIERKLVDVRQSEALIQELQETYNSNLAQLESREKAYQTKVRIKPTYSINHPATLGINELFFVYLKSKVIETSNRRSRFKCA